jgi:hypothetical protein
LPSLLKSRSRRKKKLQTPLNLRGKVGTSRFGIRSRMEGAEERQRQENLDHCEMSEEEDGEHHLKTPKAPCGPLAMVCEDKAHSGNTAEIELAQKDYQPPPQAQGGRAKLLQRPESSRSMVSAEVPTKTLRHPTCPTLPMIRTTIVSIRASMSKVMATVISSCPKNGLYRGCCCC